MLGFLTGLTAIISILASCVGSNMTIYELNENVWVSILAPCVRSDKRRKEMTIYELNISILVPCVESDGHRGIYIIGNHKFQFSLPV